jgi:large subunit ribosomal protein L10
MKLADLESREVLLSKLAGAMKGTMAKAARTFDALRIKMASEQGADVNVAEVPAVAATEATESVESPVAETSAEVVVETTEAPAAEATETPAE